MALKVFHDYVKNSIKPRWPNVFVAMRWFYRELLSLRYYLQSRMHHVRWLWQYAQLCLKVLQEQTRKQSALNIVDVAHNSGPITPADFSESVKSVLEKYAGGKKRSVLSGNLAGYAENDALCWNAPYAYYSFSGLAMNMLACARSILRLSPDRLSILELGCGSGALGNLLLRLGVSRYVGIDGNALAGRFSPYMRYCKNNFLFLNLQEPIKLYANETRLYFDIVCSFEVLEHIAENALNILLQNITFHLRAGGLFICSASTGDWGDVHVTVRARAWWIERFSKYGLAEVEPRNWERKIAHGHPHNWIPELSNVFILRNKKSLRRSE